MDILLTGGTGFIGSKLVPRLLAAGHTIRIVTRRARPCADGISCLTVDLAAGEKLAPEVLGEVDAVINLAGENIGGKRWTNAQKRIILESRVRTTRALVQAIAAVERKPAIFLSASAVGYYGPHGVEALAENTAPGADFLATTCTRWEEEAQKAAGAGLRVVIARIGVVLGREGGALARMLLPFKLFVGGPLGSGEQWLSWIHIDDVAGLFHFALANDAVSGACNFTAPNPVTNAEFARTLGKILRRPAKLPTPAVTLKLLLGEQASLALEGQRAVPRAMLQAGYRFAFTTLEPALRDLLGK